MSAQTCHFLLFIGLIYSAIVIALFLQFFRVTIKLHGNRDCCIHVHSSTHHIN